VVSSDTTQYNVTARLTWRIAVLSPLHLPDTTPQLRKLTKVPLSGMYRLFQQWLMGSVLSREDTRINAIDDLPRDERYHVAIDSKKGIYESGKIISANECYRISDITRCQHKKLPRASTRYFGVCQ
jgi:hypothetical protein